MLLSVLGGRGAWPGPEQACSGYVLEQAGFRLLIDPGYATLPRLLEATAPSAVDAVLVSHGHPDHCADLNPLLRARWLSDVAAPALPIYALPNSIDRVLSLDAPEMLRGSYVVNEFDPAEAFMIGPFAVQTRSVPHFVPGVAFRITVAGSTLAYTGDGGPTHAMIELAREADVLLAEATYVRSVPAEDIGMLCSALDAGRQAREAGVRRLILTHLWPGVDPDDAVREAQQSYDGPIDRARPALVVGFSDVLGD
jgi:ribonuclease BN (tRNA processing enzyme)